MSANDGDDLDYAISSVLSVLMAVALICAIVKFGLR